VGAEHSGNGRFASHFPIYFYAILAVKVTKTSYYLNGIQKRQKVNGDFMKVMANDPDMLEEYDFSQGIRGKYAERYAEGTNVIVIDSDLINIFPDHASVNEALRSLATVIKQREKRFAMQEG
jgi:hypothetical protein